MSGGGARRFDTVLVLDWSGGNDRGPTPKKDAIWAGIARTGGPPAEEYLRNRQVAEDWIGAVIAAELAAGRRVLAGFDFPFGFPAGFARALTGEPDTLAVWDWLEARIEDGPTGSNRFDLAARINARLPGIGPFWFNGLGRDIPGLPRKGTARGGYDLPEKREAERRAKGSFAVWQLGGAGSVGSQTLTGLPVLARLRRRFAAVAWPFEPLGEAPLVLAEVWPGLIDPAVRAAMADGEIRDRVQVRLLAQALLTLAPEELARLMAVEAPEEGWILGLGHEPLLQAAASGAAPPPRSRPRLPDDCFALPPGVDWTPVDEALALLRARLGPVCTPEAVPLTQAAGRILAAPVIARRDNPPAANAAVDGYAFAFADVPEPQADLPLMPGRAAAGSPLGMPLTPGAAVRILTGAALPQGADTVVMQEDCTPAPGRVAFVRPHRAGANCRARAEDATQGDEVLPAGRRLTPADLARSAIVGAEALSVFRPLRLAVLSTGDELIQPGADPASPGIFDANRPMLMALASAQGFAVTDLGTAPDRAGAVRAALDAGAQAADAIVTTGGASDGDEDHISRLLRHEGAMTLWRIAVKPGRPLALGQWRGVPVFGLPGNPVAAFVCFLVFARPALLRMAGAEGAPPQGFILPAGFSMRKKGGRREFLRARVGSDGRAEIFRSEGSGLVGGLSWSDGLVELPDPAMEIAPGDPVRYIPYASFGI